MGLIAEMFAGSQYALSKLMTLVENDEQARQEIIKQIYPYTGKAYKIGFTGAPGVGKSTLVNAVAGEYLKRGKKVGVVAVDPSSPFSQGAVLGDRIRMQNYEENNDIFIRSLASHGKLGGLSKAAKDVIKLMDAFGKDVILIETVGTGQSELDIMHMAHTTAVVMSPGYGDSIQGMKAGILEIGDVFVVNKADMENKNRTICDIQETVAFNFHHREWVPPVMPAVAKDDQGIADIADECDKHMEFLLASGQIEQKLKKMIENDFEDYILNWVETNIFDHLRKSEKKLKLIDQLYNKEGDPFEIIDAMMKELLHNSC